MDDITRWNDNCETYVLFDILGKKWTIFVLYLIKNGHHSFNGMLKILTKLNSKVLAERLKQLEEIELIQTQTDAKNGRKKYILTQRGVFVSEQIAKLSSSHAEKLVKKQK